MNGRGRNTSKNRVRLFYARISTCILASKHSKLANTHFIVPNGWRYCVIGRLVPCADERKRLMVSKIFQVPISISRNLMQERNFEISKYDKMKKYDASAKDFLHWEYDDVWLYEPMSLTDWLFYMPEEKATWNANSDLYSQRYSWTNGDPSDSMQMIGKTTKQKKRIS